MLRLPRALVESPRVDDLIQQLVGAAEIRRRLSAQVSSFAQSRVLDVGAGTGGYVGTVPEPADYVALDLDPLKLKRLAARHPQVRALVGDATQLDFPAGAFDHGLVIFLAHHLDDDGLAQLVSRLSVVVSGTVVFLDPLRSPRLRSRLLWRIDQGSHARTADELRTAVERGFTIIREERFSIQHTYLLLVAQPR